MFAATTPSSAADLSSRYLEWDWQIFESFEKYTKVDSDGYTSSDDVTSLPPQRREKMETFFLDETFRIETCICSDGCFLRLSEVGFCPPKHE